MDMDTREEQEIIEAWEGVPLDKREEVSQIVIREVVKRWVRVFLILLFLTITIFTIITYIMRSY